MPPIPVRQIGIGSKLEMQYSAMTYGIRFGSAAAVSHQRANQQHIAGFRVNGFGWSRAGFHFFSIEMRTGKDLQRPVLGGDII